MAFKAAFTNRVSIKTTSKPASSKPLLSHWDSGPASRPSASTAYGNDAIARTSASGSLAASNSSTTFPCGPSTQIAVLARDTSNPINTFMSLPFYSKELRRMETYDLVDALQAHQGQRHLRSC